MKRRMLCFLLCGALVLGFLPGPVRAEDQSLERFLERLAWYEHDYNCTEAARSWPDRASNVLVDMLQVGNGVNLDLYPGGTVQWNWSARDPRGRWSSHFRVPETKVDWILANVYHVGAQDRAALKATIYGRDDMYYENGFYYCLLGGIGGGDWARNLQTRPYGNLTLCSYLLYDSITDYYRGQRFAVVAPENGYWTVYYCGGDAPSGTGFLDVAPGAYYEDAVRWAQTAGVTKGLSDYAFGPGRSCTRAQAVTFLWRAMGSPEAGDSAGRFRDVPEGAYYRAAVSWAVEQGVTQGVSANAFGPGEPCTRAQIVTFLHRAAGAPAVSGSLPFSDVSQGDYYAAAVKWAVQQGITQGASAGAFQPGEPCTRAEIVTFLGRYRGFDGLEPSAPWLGTWRASDGSTLEVTGFTGFSVTLTARTWTASGLSQVENTYTMPLDPGSQTVARRPFVTSDPTRLIAYTLTDGCIVVTPPAGRGPEQYYYR